MSALGSAMKVAIAISAHDMASSIIGKTFKNIDEKAKKLNERSELFSSIGDNLMMMSAGPIDFFKKSIEVAEGAEQANKRLESSFSVLGEKGKAFAEQGQELAKSWSLKIGISASDIKNTEAQFGHFKNMFKTGSKELFEDATRLAYNMQAAGKGDAQSNAAAIGAILDQPALNLRKFTALLGGKILPNQQKTIEGLIHAHRYLDAQKYALGVVEKNFDKNAAEKLAKPADKAKVSIQQLSANIGTQLLPIINSILQKVNDLLPIVTNFIQNHKTATFVIAGLSVALYGAGAAFRIFSGFLQVKGMLHYISVMRQLKSAQTAAKTSTLAMNVSMGSTMLIVLAIVAAVALLAFGVYEIIKHWSAISAFFKKLWAGIKDVFNAVWEWIKKLFFNYTPEGLIISHWAQITTFFRKLWKDVRKIFYLFLYDVIKIFSAQWDKIKAFFINLWAGVKNIFHSTWEWIKKMFFNYTPEGLIISHWAQITTFFSNLWSRVKNIFTGWINWVETLPQRLFNSGAAMISNLWNGIKSKVTWLLDKVKGVVQKIRNFFPFSPAKEGPLKDLHKVKLMETVAMSLKPQPLYGALSRALNPVGGIAAQGLNNYHSNQSIVFAPVINFSGGASKDDAKHIVEVMKKEFSHMLRQYQSQQSRINY